MQLRPVSSLRPVVAVAAIVLVAVSGSSCSTSVEVDQRASNPQPIATQLPEPTAPAVEPQPAAATEPDATTEPETSAPTKTDTATDTTNETEAAAPASTGDAEQSSEPQSTSSQSAIRQVDFHDGFVYETLLGFGPDTATVTGGSVENGEFGDDDYYWFNAEQLAYGDLDGDGAEEAVVITRWNGGGSGIFDSVRVYRLVDGQAQRAGVVDFGDRAFGGVQAARIEDGAVRVWAFADGEGACCPTQIAEFTLVLGDHSLIQAERFEPLSWLPIDASVTQRELKFLANSSSAQVWIGASYNDALLTFEASAGQTLTLHPTVGEYPDDVVLHDLTTGEFTPLDRRSELPTTGLYEVAFSFEAEREQGTMIEVAIGSEPQPVTWRANVDQVLLQQEPFVRTSVTWPIFDAVAAGTDAANEAVASFATELDDAWIADVTEYEDPQDDSSYDVTYEVHVVADDLVSVDFVYFDYVCCRPYPNYGQHGAVVDLAEGRLITADEILDLSRIGEINELWFAELIDQGQIPADAIIVNGEAVVRFDSLLVTRQGIEFGTDRGSLGGGLPGTQTLLPYNVLGDLVKPDLLARLDS